jgi:superfamily I DNA/RNA helicase
LSLDDPAIAGATPSEKLMNFLEDVTLDADRLEEKEEPENGVTLITMHSCKGLEFPHVQIAGMENGLLPHSRSLEENNKDEERRLFYVAITRAMKTLRLSYCGARKKYGQLRPCYPSPFLTELPEELLEYADDQARKPVQTDTGKSLFAAMRAAAGEPEAPAGIK